MTLKMLSLFSGIGGIDLAAQWAGIETVAFCEIDKFCQAVLRKNFGAGITIFDDVRNVTAESLRLAGAGRIDIIAGGFPCQDISHAGFGVGIDGERSGLWREMFRLICELRPRYIFVENVAALLNRGMGRVLGDLASVGFDAEWSVLSSCAMGAPHARERVFILAYPNEVGRRGWNFSDELRLEIARQAQTVRRSHRLEASMASGDCRSVPRAWAQRQAEPGIERVVDELPDTLDRLGALGNGVDTRVVYPIFEAIAKLETHSA